MVKIFTLYSEGLGADCIPVINKTSHYNIIKAQYRELEHFIDLYKDDLLRFKYIMELSIKYRRLEAESLYRYYDWAKKNLFDAQQSKVYALKHFGENLEPYMDRIAKHLVKKERITEEQLKNKDIQDDIREASIEAYSIKIQQVYISSIARIYSQLERERKSIVDITDEIRVCLVVLAMIIGYEEVKKDKLENKLDKDLKEILKKAK